jgi:uncharacterized membrane protein YhaH (DUF805 family)
MDPQQQHAANLIAGMGVGVIMFAVLFGLAILGFFIYVYWRIFTKAGLSGALSLLILVPGIGWLIVLLMLAFMDWRVVPAPNLYPGLQPYPPPPPNYPPPPPPPTSFTAPPQL